MSRSLNKAILIGNVGQEPELRTSAGGTRVAKVSLATNRQWKGRDGTTQEKTEWHRLTFFDRLAELVEQYVHKGDRLYVEGSIEYSTTEDGGTTRYWTDIVVRELVMLGGSEDRTPKAAPTPAARTSEPFEEADDDLPF